MSIIEETVRFAIFLIIIMTGFYLLDLAHKRVNIKTIETFQENCPNVITEEE